MRVERPFSHDGPGMAIPSATEPNSIAELNVTAAALTSLERPRSRLVDHIPAAQGVGLLVQAFTLALRIGGPIEVGAPGRVALERARCAALLPPARAKPSALLRSDAPWVGGGDDLADPLLIEPFEAEVPLENLEMGTNGSVEQENLRLLRRQPALA